MLIKSISLKNFQCYFGEHSDNHFDFEAGLNLIIGTNGQGKSKIFDAFYWILRDRIFNSDRREFQLTTDARETIISDKAKKLCRNGETIAAEVIMVATSYAGKQYRLTRIFKAKKVNDGEWQSDSFSKLLIDEMKGVKWVPIESSKHESILNQVIPGHIEAYMWFQGEQVHDLMDFTEYSTLSKAIELLSNVSDYDKIIEIVDQEQERAKKKFHTAQRRATSDATKSKAHEKERDDLEARLKQNKVDLVTAEENLESSKTHIDGLVAGIADAEAKANLKARLRVAEDELEKCSDDLKTKNLSLSKRIFNESWVLLNAKGSLEKFAKKYSTYIAAHQEQISLAKNEQVKLPINVPQPVYMQQMLTAEHCFVCDREAKKGSKAYQHMDELFQRSQSPEPKNVFKNDLSSYFQGLYNNALGHGKVIDGIYDRIVEEFDLISDLQSKIADLRAEITEINEKFTSHLEDDDSEDVVRSYKMHSENQERFSAEVHRLKTDIKRIEDDLKSNEKDLRKLTTGTVPRDVELAYHVFTDLAEVTKSTKSGVFERFVQTLEEKSNELFQKMTAGNDAIKGEIQIRKNDSEKYVPYLVGTDGKVLYNPNDSNIILQKLALIMSIVGSRATGRGNYALICDAPTSKMDFEYSMGFYRTVSEEYEQSILMTFDFADDSQQFDDLSVGAAYRINARFPNGDKNDRNDLSIDVKRIA